MFRESASKRSARLAHEQIEKAELTKKIENRFKIALPEDAKNIKIKEKAELYSMFCDGEADGTLLQFNTNLKEEKIKDLFADSLGKGSKIYESLDYNFNWKWRKDKIRYQLNMADQETSIKVNFCMIE